MFDLKRYIAPVLALSLLFGTGILASYRSGYFPPPSNDNCVNATIIDITGAGYDYGVFSSTVSELTTATGQSAEFFQFAPNHTKSVWYKFSIPTKRSARIEVIATAGSIIPMPSDAGVTVYQTANCLPAPADRLGAFVSSGDLSNTCLEPGTYLIQVTGVTNLTASIFVNVTLNCPDHTTDSKYDCPANAYEFNSGLPLPANSLTDNHRIECHSIEDATEHNCLPVANRSLYLKSAWYVFTTGSMLDYLDFYYPVSSENDVTGYRLLEGNVRDVPHSTLPLIDCGIAEERFSIRYVEFPCMLKPNTTYSLALIFHRDYNYDEMVVTARQRGVTVTGWPRPVMPPVIPTNQLGTLPATALPGTNTFWSDRFDCNSFINENVCAPANPASGQVVIGGGSAAKTYNLATWATFTLAEDANVQFRFTAYNASASYHTRIFRTTIGNACPSPSPSSDLYFEFQGSNAVYNCMDAGTYSVQVLASSADASVPTTFYKDAWSYGALGTEFTLRFNVASLPTVGLFRLNAPGEYNAINNLNPIQIGTSYPSIPAVFICPNTVLPLSSQCPDITKAIYREVNIGDADGDGIPDPGLMQISGMRTDVESYPPLTYSIYRGDANQLATAASTHDAGERINGLVDHAGFCIDRDDHTNTPDGIDSLCVCVTPGTYTIAGFGNEDHVGVGDSLGFKFKIHKTIHDSRANAELINVTGVPGGYISGQDVFSCVDNLGSMPPCGRAKKLIFREFFLPEPAVTSIGEFGNPTTVLSLFQGRASDLSATLVPYATCFRASVFVDLCTPLEAGWYTVVSYGEGPNYTNNTVWNPIGDPPNEYVGDPRDVGKVSQISISFIPPITPNYNRPYKAHHAGITDWATPPANNVNAVTRRIHQFPNDTFCLPDTPFIPQGLLPCANGFNRVSMYVFEITKPSFVQIRGINATYYTEVFPFDVSLDSNSLLTVPPVYQCLASASDYRQICDLPPGTYTIVIMANDGHKGSFISPSIYVDAADLSRFDHAWNAYDFDVVPTTNTFVNGRTADVHPFLPGQAPSRDVFYCTTGATTTDPTQTLCNTKLNPLIYAQPSGVPKPLFLPNNPTGGFAQPWRNIWYTFVLTGSGICSLKTDVLGGAIPPPLFAVYESDADGNIPWATLQTTLSTPGNNIMSGLTLLDENVDGSCDAETGTVFFKKNGCLRDSVRYYVVVSFDADNSPLPPNFPNQNISLSIKYDPRPTFAAPYDERTTANIVNGLAETAPPYTSVALGLGDSFVSTDFSLLCYTRNATDPGGCGNSNTGRSAWFEFEVSTPGQLYTSLEELGAPGGWYANATDMTIWRVTTPGSPLTQRIPMNYQEVNGHEWIVGCIDPGTYYVLIRHCVDIDTLQPYRIHMELTDSPGDFCFNAIPVSVTDFNPASGSAIVDCHTIGTDVGEFPPIGNSCFTIQKRKTTWFHAIVNAGPKVDLNFRLSEAFEEDDISLNDLSYRILSGTCGALTPIVCSSVGSNVITLNCLGQGDYYVQVSMPERIGPSNNSPTLDGVLSLTVTASAADETICTDPFDPNQVIADFTYTTDCQTISLFNLSTAGTDIAYLWVFPDGTTSTDANPTWTPPPGQAVYDITLTVTNTALNNTAAITLQVPIDAVFEAYEPLADTVLCNQSGNVTMDVSLTGATYMWDDGSSNPTRVINNAGTYWVLISKNGCEKRDTVIVADVDASRSMNPTICPESSISVNGEIFDKNNPAGDVIILNAHPSGCDSIISVSLNFYALSSSQAASTICTGESFLFGGQNLTQSGIYTDTLVSAVGCDSVATLELTVTPRESIDHIESGCTGATLDLSPDISGASYEWDNAQTTESLSVNIPGTYTVSISDAADCIIGIETFEVSFGLLQSPVVADHHSVCTGEDVELTATGSSGSYQWFDALSGGNLLGTGSTFTVNNVISDTVLYVQAFQAGVDSCTSPREPVALTLSTEPIEEASLDTVICAGNTVILPWGEVVNPETNSSFTHTWPYTVSGCDSLVFTVDVNVITGQPLTLPSIITIQLGDSVLLLPQIDFVPDSIAWDPSVGLSCTNCLQPWAKPVVTTDYQLSLWSPEGCLITAVVRLEVKRDVRIFIPNVFTPNNDGFNDEFTVFGAREVVLVNQLIIYDRWGGAIWKRENFIADGSVGWDGTSRNQPSQSGVYVWLCEIELLDGTREVLSGDVTLLR